MNGYIFIVSNSKSIYCVNQAAPQAAAKAYFMLGRCEITLRRQAQGVSLAKCKVKVFHI